MGPELLDENNLEQSLVSGGDKIHTVLSRMELSEEDMPVSSFSDLRIINEKEIKIQLKRAAELRMAELA
jgi:hypothetical protein